MENLKKIETEAQKAESKIQQEQLVSPNMIEIEENEKEKNDENININEKIDENNNLDQKETKEEDKKSDKNDCNIF